jgi:ABC-2 type transport system ATP-binding protein
VVASGTPSSIGGRASANVRIRFALPAGTQLGELPVPAKLDGDEVLIETAAPTQALHALTSWAVGRNAELAGLSVTRPSLEDVYLELIEPEAPS